MEWIRGIADWSFLDQLSSVGGFVLLVAGVALAALGKLGAVFAWVFRGGKSRPDKPTHVIVVPPPLMPPAPDPPIGIKSLPPGRNVVGREAEVAALHVALQAGGAGVAITNARAVVKGQGGFGKSTLARRYAEVHGHAYHGGLWTHAGTRQAVIDGLAGLCVPLGLPVPDQPQIQHAQAVLAKVQATGKRWLFIYDNVEDIADLNGLIPDGADVIVTTRQGSGWPGWQVQEAGVLAFDAPDAPAVKLLLQEAGTGGTADEAQALARDLGGLPLALVVAGGLIRQEGSSFATYRTRLAEVLRHRPPNEDYPTSLLGAVQLSYDALDGDARMVADLCAWWAPEGLEAGLISDAPLDPSWAQSLDVIPEPMQVLARDPARVRAAFRALAARSLILPDGKGGAETWAMHRMTAAVLRLMQQASGRDQGTAAAGLLAAVYPGGDRVGHSAQWPLCARLTPHVRALWDSGEAPKIEAMEFLLNQSAVYLDKIADYAGGLNLAGASLALKRKRLPPDHRDIAVGLATLGIAYGRVGRLTEAEAKLAEAVALDEAHRPASADLAGSYDLHGSTLLDLARAGRAEVLPQAARRYQQALALWRRLAGRQSDAAAHLLNNLGTVRDAQGRIAAAARLYRASLTIMRAILSPDDARLAYGALNTGAAMLTSGAADCAEPLLREALEIREAAFAAQPQHPERRNAAGWLISCLLRRAQAGENRGLREMQARQLCDRYGFDFDKAQKIAAQYPYTPAPPAAP